MFPCVTVFHNDVDDRQMVQSEREFTKGHLSYGSEKSVWVQGPFDTKRTDVLSSVLDLREDSWNLGKVVSFRVEHRVIGAVVHSIEGDLELNNFVWGRQLRLDNRRNKDRLIRKFVELQRHR